MIELEQAAKIYILSEEQQVTAVAGVDLRIDRGEFVVMTGRSGSGKTTVLNLIAGLTPPMGGRVLWDGTDLWALTDRQRSELRRARIGFVFQFPSLLPALTTVENVMLSTAFGGPQPANPEARARELLATVGLADKLRAFPRQLSAGQQQRVVIARALFNAPEVLLADEPTSDLDEGTEEEIMDLFQKIHQATGVTVIMVTHTSQLVRYGTRAVQMSEGHMVRDAPVVGTGGDMAAPPAAPLPAGGVRVSHGNGAEGPDSDRL